MRIAISTDGGSVSAHFGRCPSYTLVDVEDGKVVERREIPNPGHSPGFLPAYLGERGVTTVIAGGMGPRAQGLFAENGIETIIGVEGPVDEVIDRFIRGALEPGRDLCDHNGHRHEGPCRNEREAAPVPGARPLGPGPIAVSAKGRDLDAELDPHFGRAPYFLFVDPSTGAFEAVENRRSDAAHGAGIQSAQLVAARRPAALLTGQVGPNAARVLDAAGVRVIGVEGCTVRQALEALKQG
ncbi:MAG TPA: NifB/NifX family molybdenum-iron cluster-binding protein [Candidatus Aminicenantes bacterium]|nr:NifB/NifX family molybdenum-iron cluster-binding protein [Candidatus Aminicenantes bacterium]